MWIYNVKKYTGFYAHYTVSNNRVNIDVSSVCAACIKSCINNVPLKKPQTLLNKGLWLFGMLPNFRLGTLLNLFCILYV